MMSYFKKYHSNHWKCVVMKLEIEQPITSHCSDHWKAEHLLAKLLQGNGNDLDDLSTKATKRAAKSNTPVPSPAPSPAISGQHHLCR